MKTQIIFLHGLGASPITFWPLEMYLALYGFTDIDKIYYPFVNTKEYKDVMVGVDELLSEKYNKQDTEFILVGQSMGGVVSNNLHRYGWKIKGVITLASPLHGARLLETMDSILPNKIKEFFYKKPYDYLRAKGKDEKPPHPIHTISVGWFYSNFDGCVFKDETMFEENNHTHLYFSDHRAMMIDPRLWHSVLVSLRKINASA